MPVPLLDLKAQYRSIKVDLDAALMKVVESQYFILGPAVQSFEQRCSEYNRAPHSIGVASGTDALLIALMAEEIGAGAEVITSSYTFFATAGSIARCGARPVFVDIDPLTYNLDVRQVEAAITSRTRAIMPVHLYGQCADMDPLLALAKSKKLAVIEDAAQAIGAEYKGRRAGSMGDYGCFSFFPSKNLGGYGDGGLVSTGDAARAKRLAMLRVHGMEPKYYHQLIGGNFRLDALQAAVLEVKLRHLDSWTAARQQNARRYDLLFAEAGLLDGRVHTPVTSAHSTRHIFNQYVIRAARRDDLIKHLAQRQIGCEVYYPVPLHRQQCFASLGYLAGALPESERAAAETLALPVFPELTDTQAREVVSAISEFYAG